MQFYFKGETHWVDIKYAGVNIFNMINTVISITFNFSHFAYWENQYNFTRSNSALMPTIKVERI